MTKMNISLHLRQDVGQIREADGHTYHLRGWLKPLFGQNRNFERCRAYIDVYRGTGLLSTDFKKKNRVGNLEVTMPLNGPGVWKIVTIDGSADQSVALALVNHCWSFLNTHAVDPRFRVPMLALMASGMFETGFLESLSTAGALRAMYRVTVGMKGTKYPPRQEMLDRITNGGGLTAEGSNQMWDTILNCVGPEMPDITLNLDWAPRTAGTPKPTPKAEPTPKPTPKAEPTPEPATTIRVVETDVDVTRLSVGELADLAKVSEQRLNAIGQMTKANEALSGQVSDLTKQVAQLSDDLAEANDKVNMFSEAASPEPAVIATGDEVEVLGVKLPRWNCPDAPAIDDRYDLAAWQAVLKVNDATFTANAAMVAKSIIDGDSVRLIGPPSVGKTSGIRQVAGHCGAKFFLVQCGEGATDLSLIGSQTVSEGEMKWQDGSITHAVRWAADNPDTLTLVVLDEVDHLQPEVQSLLHGVLEGGLLQYDGTKEMAVTSNVRFVATANTSGFGDVTGRHSAAKVSDTAFVSRWNVTYDVAYLPPDAEAKVLMRAGNGKVSPDMAKAAVETANATRVEDADVTTPIVLRQLLSWARGVSGGEDLKTAWAFRVLSGLPEHDRAAAWEVTKMKFDW